jgi:hypothetical protein
MDQDLRHYYDAYADMFNSDGWKQLVQELQDYSDGRAKHTLSQDSAEVFHFNRGLISALGHVTSYPGLVATARESIEGGDNADF